MRSGGGPGDAGEAGGDGSWLAVSLGGTEAEGLCVLGSIRGVSGAAFVLTGGVPFLMEIDEWFEAEPSPRGKNGALEDSILFGRDILEALRTLVVE